MVTQSPYEQMKFIRDVIKDRTDKSQATFFSVELESMGNLTPLVEKENGALFYDTLIQYLTRYDVSAIIVKLYHGKSHNIKEPFQIFRIILKRTPNVTLSGIEKKNDAVPVHSETIISPEKHFQTMAENQFNLLRLQYENDVLKKKNKKKKIYIKELESTINKIEREKEKSLGNVALGSIASNALENLAKSKFGISVLKNVFKADDDFLKGLTQEAPDKENDVLSRASLVKEEAKKEERPLTEKEEVRKKIVDSISDFLKEADDGVVRLYYELFQMIGSDLKLLQGVYLLVKKHKADKAEKPQDTNVPVNNETSDEKKEREEEIDDS